MLLATWRWLEVKDDAAEQGLVADDICQVACRIRLSCGLICSHDHEDSCWCQQHLCDICLLFAG
jgi:hypothetical protein